MSDLAAAWRVNAQLTTGLLEAIPPAGLDARYTDRTRTVRAQFVHLQYVRVQNLAKRGAGVPDDVPAFERGDEPDKPTLLHALEASGAALEELVARFDAEGRVRNWSGRPPASYLAYLVSHESHHRALTIVALRFGGVKLDAATKATLWGAWRKAPS